MKLAIIGSRGIPANYGGFETFAEEIAVNLVKKYQYEVTVVCDADQKQTNEGMEQYKGIKLLYSKYSKSKNAILFYYDSIKMTADSSDMVYSCGPAGGMFGPIVHKHGKLLVTNPDGLNWKRAKWNKVVQTAFRTFEYLATKFSDYIACDSYGIEKHIQESYNTKNTFVAEYGAYPNSYIGKDSEEINDVLEKYGVKKGAYHLVVSRLEPENHVHVILEGYTQEKRKYPLLVVGNLKETNYIKQLQDIANDSVLFVGGIYNKKELEIVRSNALDYLHGHSVGGTNPSLLEAMASRNLCICHDNIFNREVVGTNGLFFKTYQDVSNYLHEVEHKTKDFDVMREGVFQKILSYYTWEAIAAKYNKEFVQILKETKKS